MEDYNLSDSDFTTVVIKKLNEQQENSEKQFSELRNKINEQEYFPNQTETLKKNLTKTLELKN